MKLDDAVRGHQLCCDGNSASCETMHRMQGSFQIEREEPGF